MDDPLIYARAIHFAATITVAGVVFFAVFIAEPAFAKTGDDARLPAAVGPPLAWLKWAGLALAGASGAAWFILVAASMSERPPAEVLSEGIVWVVLLQTDFGRAWLVRAILACVLAAVFAGTPTVKRKRPTPIWRNVLAMAMAAGLVGLLAWAGHAAGGAGAEGIIHPAADFLHLVAAAAWVGALIPLALLLGASGRDFASVAAAQTATLRFSAFGVASVATLLVTVRPARRPYQDDRARTAIWLDHMTMANAAFRDNVFGEPLHFGPAPLEYGDFHATLLIEVHVQRRLCQVAVFVEIACKALRQFARFVVVDIDQSRHTRTRSADLHGCLLKAGAGQVADRL